MKYFRDCIVCAIKPKEENGNFLNDNILLRNTDSDDLNYSVQIQLSNKENSCDADAGK